MKNLIALPLCLGLLSCAQVEKQAQEAQEAQETQKPTSRYIGQVASVHANQGFVLIQRGPGITVSAGSVLISQGLDGSAANLRVSGEMLGQMMAADIQSGSPQRGDSVREPLFKEGDLQDSSTDQDS